MVTHRRRIPTQAVLNQHVRQPGLTGGATTGGRVIEVGAGSKKRSGNKHIPGGEAQGIFIVIPQGIHHGGKADGILEGRDTGFLVRGVENL
jgi:hypothetical protein